MQYPKNILGNNENVKIVSRNSLHKTVRVLCMGWDLPVKGQFHHV